VPADMVFLDGLLIEQTGGNQERKRFDKIFLAEQQKFIFLKKEVSI